MSLWGWPQKWHRLSIFDFVDAMNSAERSDSSSFLCEVDRCISKSVMHTMLRSRVLEQMQFCPGGAQRWIVSANVSPSAMPSKVSIGNRIQWGGLERFVLCRHDASV